MFSFVKGMKWSNIIHTAYRVIEIWTLPGNAYLKTRNTYGIIGSFIFDTDFIMLNIGRARHCYCCYKTK